MDYTRVLAIDAGTRNFAYCLVDNNNCKQPIAWEKVDLWQPKPGRRGVPTIEDIITVTHEWINANQLLFMGVDLIVLEKQIRKPFIVQNTVINAIFYDRCIQVHPMTVAAYFGLPKKREQKKLATVALVQRHCVLPPVAKPDDLADAWVMAMYYMIQRKAVSASDIKT